jgi:hypothetical protein
MPTERPLLSRRSLLNSLRVRQNELVKRLLWTGLMAGVGALATIASNKVAAAIWEQVTGEEPPDIT